MESHLSCGICRYAKIDIVKIEEDAMLFDIGKTKTDQEGSKNIDHPWHVFSNPEMPYICCVLAMARHLICNPTILNGRCNLFEGSSQYDRFNRIFIDVISDPEYRETFTGLGIPPEHFGTHSIRKGAVTHVATGSTSSPPIASICIRANWAMPGVMNRYIRFENAGDQFVGKCVSGRDRKSKTFAESCAYFDFSAMESSQKDISEREVHTWIKDPMPDLAKANEDVFGLFKMCIALLCLHQSFLEEELHRNSMVRSSIYMIESSPHAQHVTTKFPWDKTDDTPELTGLPPDVLALAEFESMRLQISKLKADLESSFESTLKRELDGRAVGGAGYAQAEEIMKKLDSLIKWTNDKPSLLNDVNGDGNEVNHNPLGFYIEEEDGIVIRCQEPPVMTAARPSSIHVRECTKKQLEKRQLSIGFHHGQLNPLPSAWRYPHGMTLIQLMNLWLIGIREDNVPPLAMVSPALVSHFDDKSRQYSRMRQLMQQVEHFGRARGVWVKYSQWDGANVTDLWSAIWSDFDPYLHTETQRARGQPASHHKSRRGQLAWRTCYNKLENSGILKEKKTHKRAKTSDDKKEREDEEKRKKRLAVKQEMDRQSRAIAQTLAEKLKRPLSITEQGIVQNALSRTGLSSDILARYHSDSVSRKSMQSLLPGQWLNDEVINYFLKNCLSNRDVKLCAKHPGRKRSHFFNSFFLQNLFDEKNDSPSLQGQYDYSNVKAWGAKVPGGDVFDLQYIVCPINVKNRHWASIVVFMEEKRIQYYDSLGQTDWQKLGGILRYLKDEHTNKKGRDLDADKWSLVRCTSNTPRQTNGECHYFAIAVLLNNFSYTGIFVLYRCRI